MRNVLKCVNGVQKGEVKNKVERRMGEFRRLGRKSSDALFKELCFCILTANYTAEGGMRIQKEIGDGFLRLSEGQLAKRLKELRYRFPNVRAKYIVEARKHRTELVRNMMLMDEHELRDWLVRNVKGLGYKEASHFLRNVGYGDVAIVDFHIVDFLVGHGMIEKPKTLTKNRYVEIEDVLRRIAGKSGMNLGELDLYMWYCETGKILK
jgi:N-glycosylase/DNA lyase